MPNTTRPEGYHAIVFQSAVSTQALVFFSPERFFGDSVQAGFLFRGFGFIIFWQYEIVAIPNRFVTAASERALAHEGAISTNTQIVHRQVPVVIYVVPEKIQSHTPQNVNLEINLQDICHRGF